MLHNTVSDYRIKVIYGYVTSKVESWLGVCVVWLHTVNVNVNARDFVVQ